MIIQTSLIYYIDELLNFVNLYLSCPECIYYSTEILQEYSNPNFAFSSYSDKLHFRTNNISVTDFDNMIYNIVLIMKLSVVCLTKEGCCHINMPDIAAV